MSAHGMSEAGGLREAAEALCDRIDAEAREYQHLARLSTSELRALLVAHPAEADPTAGEREWEHVRRGPFRPTVRTATPDTDGANASAGEGLSEDDREALTGAVHYARTYWRFGNEPETQAALTTLAAAVDRLAGREAAAATKRMEDAAQTIALMPAEHRPRSVVASIFTGHTLGCICEVCSFMGEEPSAAATKARAEAGEQIAQAIEAAGRRRPRDPQWMWAVDAAVAARIAREVTS